MLAHHEMGNIVILLIMYVTKSSTIPVKSVQYGDKLHRASVIRAITTCSIYINGVTSIRISKYTHSY